MPKMTDEYLIIVTFICLFGARLAGEQEQNQDLRRM